MRKIIIIAAILLLTGCTVTKYVPYETIRNEIVYVHDTVKQSDSVKSEKETIIREARPEDSAMIAKLGIRLRENERLLILLQKELSEAKSSKQETHNKDSVRNDSVQVPYPVEKQLSRFQQFCLDWGKLTLGGSILAVVLIIVWLVRWLIRRQPLSQRTQ